MWLSIGFGDFGIAELFLIGVKLLLRHMHNLEIFVQSHQFTKIDGEPHFFPFQPV